MVNKQAIIQEIFIKDLSNDTLVPRLCKTKHIRYVDGLNYDAHKLIINYC